MVELWDYSIQPRKKKGKTLRREQIFILFSLEMSLVYYLCIIVYILAFIYKAVLLETSIPNGQ